MASKKKPTNKAKISLKNIVSFVQGHARKFSDSFGTLPDYQKEQIIWRSAQAQACTDNKACLFCGCETPELYYADAACKDPDRKCFPNMMNEDDWEQFKVFHKITIKID